MTLFLSYLINGINLGSIYAIIALGYTMVYGIARMLNFAHGDVIMIGAYICFIAVSSMGLSPLLGVLLAMVVCTVLGMTIERLAYRPLRQAASLAVLITAIGISYLLQNVAQLIWTANPKSFPMLVETLIENAAVALGLTTPEKIAMTPNFGDIVLAENLRISGTTIVTILANILIMVGLTLFTGHTKRGKAMRAVSEDRGAAELMGISVNHTITLTFAIGSALAAIAGSVYVKIISGAGAAASGWIVLLAFLACMLVAMLFGAFNGTLVAVFKIQPMIATLILYTCGRSIAYWINGGATPTISNAVVNAIGSFIPGIPVPTPIFIVIICGIIFALLFRFTTLSLMTQAVGINQRAARLNGINSTGVKLLTFVILGACCAVSGTIAVGRMGLINHETVLSEIEMDAILAVAIGGNALGGGRFKLSGSVLGAYAIQALTTTLYAMKVPSTDIKAYKAIVIILLVFLCSVLCLVVPAVMSRVWYKRLHPPGDSPPDT